jgi:drug/metabolite transporter (DMT)-like permease
MLTLGLFWFACTVVADFLAKLWSVKSAAHGGYLSILVLAALVYFGAQGTWILMLYEKLPMAKGSAVFACLGLTGGVLAGLVMGEHFSTLNWCGAALAVAAIVCVSL